LICIATGAETDLLVMNTYVSAYLLDLSSTTFSNSLLKSPGFNVRDGDELNLHCTVAFAEGAF
jgi:hypothetical protein